MSKFLYYTNSYIDKCESNAMFISVPIGIQTKLDVFKFYFKKLNFPSYFGFNWDALYDCLSDLDWINEYNIIIVHEDIPFLEDKNERDIYIKLLVDVIESWKDSDMHELQIFFPEKYRYLIESS